MRKSPITNDFSHVLHRVSFGKQYMSKIPAEFLEKKETSYGICVCKVSTHIQVAKK